MQYYSDARQNNVVYSGVRQNNVVILTRVKIMQRYSNVRQNNAALF